MLAEEDPLEVAGVGTGPQVEVPVEVVVDGLRIGSRLDVEWLVEELEQPRLDHVGSPRRRVRMASDEPAASTAATTIARVALARWAWSVKASSVMNRAT